MVKHYGEEAPETLFALAYIANERPLQRTANSFSWAALVFLVDFLQVWRVLVQPAFGWLPATYSVVRFFDPLYLLSWLISIPLPRYALFVIASVLSVTLLALVAAQWRRLDGPGGRIVKSGALANALQAVTFLFRSVLFTSVIQALLIPLDCAQPSQTELAFSEQLRGEGAECSPFIFPDVIASVVGLVLAPMVFVVTLKFSSLAIEMHPLVATPEATSEGNIAHTYTVFKLLAVVAPFLVPFVTDLACALVLLVIAALLLRTQTKYLPHHMHESNCLRCAGYAGLTWICFACLVNAVVRRTSVSISVLQTLQWILAGATTGAMMGGVRAADLRQANVILDIERLRGDWEAKEEQNVKIASLQRAYSAAMHASAAPLTLLDADAGKEGSEDDSSRSNNESKVALSVAPAKKKNAYIKFFHPRMELQRASRSGHAACTVVRTLLSMRKKEDFTFLAYLVSRGIEENPASEELLLLRLQLLRFVLRQTNETNKEEKRLDDVFSESKESTRFALFCYHRRATDEYFAEESLQGGRRGVNPLTFDADVTRVRMLHLDSLKELRKMWQSVQQAKKKGGVLQVHSQAMNALQCANEAIEAASEGYRQLLDVYPRSIPVLQLMESFSDVVQNDRQAALHLHSRIEIIQSEDFERTAKQQEEAEDGKDVKKHGRARSETTLSSDADERTRAARDFTNHWSPLVLETEVENLNYAHRRIEALLFVLLCVSGAGYFVSQFWLFTEQAQKEVHRVEAAGSLRVLGISGLFYSRNKVLAALSNNSHLVSEFKDKALLLSERLQMQHVENYENIRSSDLRNKYLEKSISVSDPIGSSWRTRNVSFWTLGIEVSRRMRLASQIPVHELLDPEYRPSNISQAKLGMVWIAENIFRSALSAFDDMAKVYEVNMVRLSTVTSMVVSVSAGLHCFLLVIIVSLAIYANSFTIKAMHHALFVSVFVFSLPSQTAKSLKTFYADQEKEMRMMDQDEAGERDAMVAAMSGNELQDFDCAKSTESEEHSSHIKPYGITRGAGRAAGTNGGKGHATELSADVGLGSSNSNALNASVSPGRYPDTPNSFTDLGTSMSGDDLDARLSGQAARGSRPRGKRQQRVAFIELQRIFQTLDANGNGTISHAEFIVGLKANADIAEVMGMPREVRQEDGTREKYQLTFGKMDFDSSKNIDFAELCGHFGYLDDGTTIPLLSPADAHEMEEEDAVQEIQSVEVSEEGPQVGDDEDSMGQLEEVEDFTEEELVDKGESAEESGDEVDGEESNNHDEKPSLPLQKLNEEEIAAMASDSNNTQPLLVWPSFICFVMFVTCALCVFQIVYPAREMGQVVLLAPTVNQASRRIYLARTIAFLSRELVLDDGLSRMHPLEIASFLNQALDEFTRVDKAVRFGNDLGIGEGADQHNHEHNVIMYGDGCPWRGENATNCSTPLRPGVAEYGLRNLVGAFIDASRLILLRYGPDPEEYGTWHLQNPRSQEAMRDEYYKELHVLPARMSKLESDEEVVFIVSCFEEDLYLGLEMILTVFDRELKHLIDIAISDGKLFFAIYMTVLVGGFYFAVWRGNVAYARREAAQARQFVRRLPVHVISAPERQSISVLFDRGLLSAGKLCRIIKSKVLGKMCGVPATKQQGEDLGVKRSKVRT